LKSCKETEAILHRILIYKIVRHIILGTTTPNGNFICTFPSGNGYIDVVFTWKDDEIKKVERFQLDPGAPKEVLLTTTTITKNET
jgi:hypothetical protein